MKVMAKSETLSGTFKNSILFLNCIHEGGHICKKIIFTERQSAFNNNYFTKCVLLHVFEFYFD